MKQNTTLAIEQPLLKRARAIAAQRGTSISRLLAKALEQLAFSSDSRSSLANVLFPRQ